METFHGTTILAVRHRGSLAVAGDGQITLGNSVVKHHARKVRRIYNDKIIIGFAGATADALNLSERLEEKLERYNGNLTRSAVELARDWRTDKYLRRLEAMMLVADASTSLIVTGTGDVTHFQDFRREMVVLRRGDQAHALLAAGQQHGIDARVGQHGAGRAQHGVI